MLGTRPAAAGADARHRRRAAWTANRKSHPTTVTRTNRLVKPFGQASALAMCSGKMFG
jgi:hypothetical protein